MIADKHKLSLPALNSKEPQNISVSKIVDKMRLSYLAEKLQRDFPLMNKLK
jgi:hypothetical protein